MSHSKVHVEVDGDVGRITLDRPDRMNACTGGMFDAIHQAAIELRNANPRVCVITGTGGNFCSGADVSGEGEDAIDGVTHGLQSMRRISDAVVAVHSLPMPVIAAVDGVSVGAGFGLALAADLMICTDRARFALIFAKRGLSLDFGTSYLLPQRVGLNVAKQMAFTAEIIGAERALEVGITNEVVAADDLDAAVQAMAERIAAGPPLALSMSKRMLDNAALSSLQQAVEAETLAQNVNFGTHDQAEGGLAFVERRDPRFRGN